MSNTREKQRVANLSEPGGVGGGARGRERVSGWWCVGVGGRAGGGARGGVVGKVRVVRGREGRCESKQIIKNLLDTPTQDSDTRER